MTNLQKKAEATPEMTPEAREAVRQKLNAYRDTTGYSYERLSRQFSINAGTLNLIANGKTEKGQDHLLRSLVAQIESRTQGGKLYPTATVRNTFSFLSRMQSNHYMGGIEGDTGQGKTAACKGFSSAPNVFYLSYGYGMNPNRFMAALMNELGITYTGKPDEVIQRIARHLNTLSDPLLIIDEAGKMPKNAMMALQELRDQTQFSTAIVLVGMPYFRDDLEKYAERGKRGYSEFNRRIEFWLTLTELSRKEVADICTANGITDTETVERMKSFRKMSELRKELIEYHIQNATNYEAASN